MSESPPRGRRPAADPHIPPECRDMIRRGALLAINSSVRNHRDRHLLVVSI